MSVSWATVHNANKSPAVGDRDAGGKNDQRAGTIQSVERAIQLLQLLDGTSGPLTPREIADRTGLSRPTVYRFCSTLEGLGFVEVLPDRKVRLGLAALSLGHSEFARRDLQEAALPVLERLREDTGETVNLAKLDGTEIVFLLRLRGTSLMSPQLTVGSRLPCHPTSLGRAMLAFMSPGEREAHLAGELPRLTEQTDTDRKHLAETLDTVRRLGFATNEEEVAPGLRSIAAPVLDSDGHPVAAINIAIARPFARSERASLAKQVVAAADEISALAATLPPEAL